MDAPTDGDVEVDAEHAADRQHADLERRLDALERESNERRAELRAIAASLPEMTSRRALVRSLASDLRGAPDRVLVAKRVVLKALRTPADLVRRSRRR